MERCPPHLHHDSLPLLHLQYKKNIRLETAPPAYTYVNLASPYHLQLVLDELRSPRRLGGPWGALLWYPPPPGFAVSQYCEYEDVEWDDVLGAAPKTLKCNCYCIRKGLTRKAALCQVVNRFLDNHSDSVLRRYFPPSAVISTREVFSTETRQVSWLNKYRDTKSLLNECLYEADELFSTDATTTTYLLKPSISSKGDAIQVFNGGKEEMRAILRDHSDIHEWVLQRYVPNLLLLNGNRKFHLRVFIVCVGALQVHLLTDYIAFFSSVPFRGEEGAPADDDHFMHITNAYHQKLHADFVEEDSFRSSRELAEEIYVKEFPSRSVDDLVSPSGAVLSQIAACLRETFEALRSQPAVFQPLDNCYELFGLDFLLQEDLTPVLLEFNSGPDLDQAGDRLRPIIKALIGGVFDLGLDGRGEAEGFVKVYDEEWRHAKNPTQRVF